MSELKEKLTRIKNRLEGYGAQLVAVSKYRPLAQLQEAIDAGQLHLGENRVQEMVEKQAALPTTVCWHQIGTLQRNKAKYIAPFVHLVHSADGLALLQELDKQAAKAGRRIPYLLQMHIAQEDTKQGLDRPALEALLQDPLLPTLQHVELQGLMGMATLTDDTARITAEFAGLRALFDELRRAGYPMQTLSMGMSNDWELALEQGSTMVRVGSALFA